MLVEGIDDSVLSLVTLFAITSIILMLTYFKNNFLTVRQENPRLHNDSVEIINQVRIENNISPSAPPFPDLHEHRRGSTNNTQLNCPICLTETVLPIETNCGHIFCASCIVQYWRHTNSTYSKIKCPMCRQLVSCLLPLFSRNEEQRRLNSENNTSEIINNISSYNRRFSGAPRPFMDYLTDIPVLLRHIINELFSLQGLELWHRIRWTILMIIGFLYFISPFDIIPEIIFGIFGFLDDIFVFVILAIYITILYRRVIANRT